MVMTSDMWHILFEPARENEYIYVLNEIRPKRKYRTKLDVDDKISRKENENEIYSNQLCNY